MSKKIIVFIMSFCLVLTIVACNNTTSERTSTTLSTESSTSIDSTTSQTMTASTTTTTTTITTSTTEASYVYDPISVSSAVLEEEHLSFKFFWEVVNGDPESAGYGLISDRINTETMNYAAASMASVGFGLAAIPIGIENAWISYQEGVDRVEGTLTTLEGMQRTHGFYYHFVSMSSGMRSGSSEVSIIDTAILMCGAIMAGEYFGGDIKERVNALYQAVEWNWYFDTNRMMFYMGYTPESGFGGHWDMYAEQLMIYFLAAASDNYAVSKAAYDQMKNGTQKKNYGTASSFYVSWPGTLFTYQYSHAFFDFRSVVDDDGINWHDNSVSATLSAYDFGQWLSSQYETYGETAWGNTASDCPDGYCASGNLPAAGTIYIDGTLAPSGAIGSIVFRPDLVVPAIEHYASIVELQSRYGFIDAYNLGVTSTASSSINRPNATLPEDGWYSSDVIGIDKGITVLMIENYRSEMVWDFFMKSEIIQKGYEELGFTFSN